MEVNNRFLNEKKNEEIDNQTNSCSPSERKREASWPAVLFYIHLNILGFYGILMFFTYTSLTTMLFTTFLTSIGILGMTCGAHRLWAHKTYEATPVLRFILMICQTMAGLGSIYDWVRLHRLHHQTFETPDDPYYSDKDLLHSHVFAQIRKLSQRQEKLLAKVNMSDIETDGIVMFQKRFYWILYIIFFVLLPINAPLEYWNDTIQAAIFVVFSLRYLIVINAAWLINSAHFIWGLEKSFKPSESNIVFLVTKSYWPQYHYLMPWDYKSGEFGTYGAGCSTAFIRVFAALEMATELKTISSEAVKKGLILSVESGRPVVECIAETAKIDMVNLPKDHYLRIDMHK